MNRRLILTLAAALAFSSLASAADTPKAASLDPKVHDVITSTAAFYAGKNTVQADVLSAMNIGMSGIKQEMDSGFRLALQRPNLFALDMQSGVMGGTLVCDGKTSIVYQPLLGKYTSSDAPADIATLLEPMTFMLVGGGPLSLGFENFLRKDPVAQFQENLKSSQDCGLEKVGDVPAHHIQMVNPPYTTDLWIEDGASPIILKAQVAMDMSAAVKAMPEAAKKLPGDPSSMTMSRTTTFANWKFDQPIPAAAFVFNPPLGAKLVTDFVPPKAHPLSGKMAPDFELKDLDGKSVPLKSLRGKIVVLDFWATWCGPCVATLPIVTQVASSFASQGVVFYAINQKEKAADIRKFQSDKTLSFPVLLDSDGKVGDLYQASAIPQSVLIDKDGRIAAIHVGYSPSLKETLTRQLTALVAGKPLTDEKATAPASSAPATTP